MIRHHSTELADRHAMKTAAKIGAFLALGAIGSAVYCHSQELPDAPRASLAAVTIPEHPKKFTFWTDPTNRRLMLADAGVRANDAFTTWLDRPSHCSGCYEANLPAGMAASLPAMLAYGAGVSLGLDYVSAKIWGDGRSKKRRWAARGLIVADIAYDSKEGFGNYRLVNRWK